MKKNRGIKYILLLSVILLGFTIYIQSFEDIESVCERDDSEETFLINYAIGKNLKQKIYKHTKNFKLTGPEFRRVYLKNNIFKIGDPIFGNDINYREKGCGLIDVMDIYCIADFEQLGNGKTGVYYNFMEDGYTVKDTVE